MPLQTSPPQQLPAVDAATTTLLQYSGSPATTNSRTPYIVLLVINFIALFIGNLASSLLNKFYFIHNGSSRWVTTWVQCGGFPLLFIPIFLPYLLKITTRKPFTNVTRKLLILSVLIGFGLGLNNLLISWGTSYLPVSTSSLLLSSQLAFTLILSCVIVKERITLWNLKCVILLTVTWILLALSSSHDRPAGITEGKYFVGYACTIGAALLFSLYLPITEKVYREVNCYAMVMEMQLVMEIAATVLATAGMAVDGGIRELKRESEDFDLGSRMYTLTIIATIITWQLAFMGTAGMIYLTTSFTSGVFMTALLVVNVVGGVIVYGDRFDTNKVVSMVLCIWGLCSHLYGLYVKNQIRREINS